METNLIQITKSFDLAKYNLNISNYFQTGMLYFDTDIIDFHTKVSFMI